jgi:RNA polymerase sigma factor (sigma-70 family)
MSGALSSIHMGRTNEDFRHIYETFYYKVYRKAFQVTRDAHLAEDIMQETFIKAYNKLDTIIERDKIEAWLSTIASRTAIDFIRKEKGKATVPIEEMIGRLDQTLENNFSVEKKVEQMLLKQEIEQQMTYLKPTLKEVLVLKYKKGFSDKEIARLLQIPNNTVKSRLHRARKQLKTEVEIEFQIS